MYLDLQLPMQSVPITTDVVGLTPAQGLCDKPMWYNVIKFISDLRQVGDFLFSTPVSSTNETDHHDIAEILLKVALNTIKPTNQ